MKNEHVEGPGRDQAAVTNSSQSAESKKNVNGKSEGKEKTKKRPNANSATQGRNR